MENISALTTGYGNLRKSLRSFLIFTLIDVVLLCSISWALFSSSIEKGNTDSGFSRLVQIETSPESEKRCVLSFSAKGTAKKVFATASFGNFEFHTETFLPGEKFSFELCGYSSDELTLDIHSGALAKSENESLIENGKAYAIIGGKLTELSVYRINEGDTVEFIASKHNRSAPAYQTSAEAIKAYNYIFDEEDFDSYYSEVIIPPSDFLSFVDTLPVAEDIPFEEMVNEEEPEDEED